MTGELGDSMPRTKKIDGPRSLGWLENLNGVCSLWEPDSR